MSRSDHVPASLSVESWAPPPPAYTPRELVDSGGRLAGTPPVSFGRVTRSGPVVQQASRASAASGPDGMMHLARVQTPKGETRLWRARDKLAEKTGVKHTVYAVNGEQYTGEWLGDVKHGQGVQVYVDGSRYDGMWERGKRHGQGTFYKRVGGRLRLVYSGVWEHDQRAGTGSLNFKNGNRYEGNFEEGKITGWGTMYYKDGDRYEGEFIDGRRHGFGTLHLANGNRYEGHWVDDVKEGKGTFYYMSRNQRYDGEWVGDQPKCGAISELNPDAEATIPSLGLADPARVLAYEIRDIQAERAGGSGESNGYDNNNNYGSNGDDGRGSGAYDSASSRFRSQGGTRLKFKDQVDNEEEYYQ